MGYRPVFGLVAGLMAVASCSAAHAQLVGTYAGTQANGALIGLTIELGKKNQLELSGFSIGVSTTCPDGETIGENVGLGLEPVPINARKFTFKFTGDVELYLDAVMTFDNSTQSVSGTATAYVPALDKFTNKPKKSETCVSKQTFSATLGTELKTPAGKPRIVIY